MRSDRRPTRRHATIAAGVIAVVVALLAVVAVGGLPAVIGADEPATAKSHTTTPTVEPTAETNTESTVSEEAADEPVPGPDDPYFEAAADDGSWISYVNPRDEYRSPYLGDGSGKLCVTLLNEAGEPITGESVPNTTVTVPTGEETAWHSQADPMVVEYPLTENYERPLDSDQFGTDPDLPQGDGYLDSHCIELHGFPEDETVTYGEAQIDGEHADDIEVVGYVQQANEAWDSDVDPIEDAEPYEQAGGWTYEPGGSHGQAVVVLQLAGADDAPDENGTVQDDGNATESDETDSDTESANSAVQDDTDDGADGADDGDEIPGFGVGVAVIALVVALAVVAARRGERGRR